MVEKKGLGKAIGHAFLWFGIAIVLFPLYIALVATTHTFDVLIGSTPLWFGGEFLKNFTTVLTQGLKAAGGIRTLAQAMAMVEAGADRIGTSSMLTIARELEAKAHA